MNTLQHCALAAPLGLLLLACSSSPAAPARPGIDASVPSDGSTAPGLDASGGSDDGGNDAGPVVVNGVDASACAAKPTTGDFPADVAAVLAAKCQTCHKQPPINHAPFSLLTYADTLALDTLQPFAGEPIWEAMSSVIQPGAVPHMPFGTAPQLTTAEYQTLHDWLFSCALPVASTGDAGDDAGLTDASTD